MHRPLDGAQLIVEAATRHIANSETTTDDLFSQLISPRCCSWTSSVQCVAQLPNMRCLEFGRHIIRQLNKGVSLLFSVEIRSPNIKHSHDNVFTLGRLAGAITALTNAKSGVSEKYSCLSPQKPQNSWATPPCTQLRSVIGPFVDCNPSGANDTASLLRSIGPRNDVTDSHLVHEVFLLYLGTMDQNWVEFFAMPNRLQDATFVLTNTLPNGFLFKFTIVITDSSKKIEKTLFIRHEFSGDSTTGASNSRTI